MKLLKRGNGQYETWWYWPDFKSCICSLHHWQFTQCWTHWVVALLTWLVTRRCESSVSSFHFTGWATEGFIEAKVQWTTNKVCFSWVIVSHTCMLWLLRAPESSGRVGRTESNWRKKDTSTLCTTRAACVQGKINVNNVQRCVLCSELEFLRGARTHVWKSQPL